MPYVFRLLLPALFSAFAITVAAQVPPSEPPPAYLKEVGYEDLVLRLGDKAPNGAGVWVMQVEPSESGEGKPPQYRPDPKAVLGVDRPGFTMTVPGQEKGPFSGHANMVAQHFYGRASMAKGITRVDVVNPETEFVPQWLGYPKGDLRTMTEIPKVSMPVSTAGRNSALRARRRC